MIKPTLGYHDQLRMMANKEVDALLSQSEYSGILPQTIKDILHVGIDLKKAVDDDFVNRITQNGETERVNYHSYLQDGVGATVESYECEGKYSEVPPDILRHLLKRGMQIRSDVDLVRKYNKGALER